MAIIGQLIILEHFGSPVGHDRRLIYLDGPFEGKRFERRNIGSKAMKHPTIWPGGKPVNRRDGNDRRINVERLVGRYV